MTKEDLENLGTAIAVLRTVRGRDQAALARAAGVQASSISDYERGKVRPSARTLDRLLSGLRLPASALGAALGFVRSLQRGEESAPAAGPEATAASFGDAEAGFVRVAATLAKERLPIQPSREEPDSEAEAARLWERLRRYGARERRAVVNESPQFSSWGLCVLLCEESARTAADEARRAVDLAELALLVAGRVPGPEPWRLRLQGWASAFLGKARRAQGNLAGAEEAFARSHKLWQAGAPGDPGLLDESRLVELEAWLPRDVTQSSTPH
jgi:transcriptional regulator with XRE-family HTH domain